MDFFSIVYTGTSLAPLLCRRVTWLPLRARSRLFFLTLFEKVFRMETIASAVLSERRSKKPLVLFFTFSFLPPDFSGLFYLLLPLYYNFSVLHSILLHFFNNRVISWMEPLFFPIAKAFPNCEQSVNNSFFTNFLRTYPRLFGKFSGILFPAAMQNIGWKKYSLTFTI